MEAVTFKTLYFTGDFNIYVTIVEMLLLLGASFFLTATVNKVPGVYNVIVIVVSHVLTFFAGMLGLVLIFYKMSSFV